MNRDSLQQSYVKYAPPSSLVSKLGTGDSYIEIWQGLPNLPFETSQSTGRLYGLRYETKDKYIWVTPNAARALKANHNTILSADIKKDSKRKLHAWCVDLIEDTAFGDTLESAISRAQTLNSEYLRESIEKVQRRTEK